MALNHKIESRMKKIMAAGLAGGLIVGVAATGIFTIRKKKSIRTRSHRWKKS